MRLPQNMSHRFGTYKVPICTNCNDTLKEELEDPVSKAFAAGFAEVKRMADELDHRLYSWLNFLYLKTHYKDLFLVGHKSSQPGQAALGDNLIWRYFRNPHAMVRAHVFGIYIAYSTIGSMKVFRVTDHKDCLRFSYKDAYRDTALYVRIDDIAIVCSLDDFGACKYFLDPFHDSLGDELAIKETLAVLNEYEMAGRRLYGKWVLAQEYDPSNGSIRLEGDVLEPMGMRPATEQLRRDGLRYQIEPFLMQTGVPAEAVNLILDGIESGRITYLPKEAMQTLEGATFDADWQVLRQPN
jgi:hypothetical protein